MTAICKATRVIRRRLVKLDLAIEVCKSKTTETVYVMATSWLGWTLTVRISHHHGRPKANQVDVILPTIIRQPMPDFLASHLDRIEAECRRHGVVRIKVRQNRERVVHG